MKFDHVVNHNGKYYLSGEEVPIGEPSSLKKQEEPEDLPFSDSDIEFDERKHRYTYEELEPMTAKEIRRIADGMGIKITKVIKDDIINEFLSKQ